MGKRYGRNQKRKHRAELASIKAMAAELAQRAQDRAEQVRMLERKIDALEAVVQGAKDALGKESILFEPVMRMAMNHYLPIIRLPEFQTAPTYFDLDADAASCAIIRDHAAAVLDFNIKRDHWARQKHFMVAFKDRQIVGYAIDERLLTAKEAENIVGNQIARTMARQFMKELRGMGMR